MRIASTICCERSREAPRIGRSDATSASGSPSPPYSSSPQVADGSAFTPASLVVVPARGEQRRKQRDEARGEEAANGPGHGLAP